MWLFKLDHRSTPAAWKDCGFYSKNVKEKKNTILMYFDHVTGHDRDELELNPNKRVTSFWAYFTIDCE